MAAADRGPVVKQGLKGREPVPEPRPSRVQQANTAKSYPEHLGAEGQGGSHELAKTPSQQPQPLCRKRRTEPAQDQGTVGRQEGGGDQRSRGQTDKISPSSSVTISLKESLWKEFSNPAPLMASMWQLEEAILNVGEVQCNKDSVNFGRVLRKASVFFARPKRSVRWGISVFPPSSYELGQRRVFRRLGGLCGSRA